MPAQPPGNGPETSVQPPTSQPSGDRILLHIYEPGEALPEGRILLPEYRRQVDGLPDLADMPLSQLRDPSLHEQIADDIEAVLRPLTKPRTNIGRSGQSQRID